MKRRPFDYLPTVIANHSDKEDKDTYYAILEEMYVQYGNDEDIDLEYCSNHKIKTQYINRNGGTIVFSPGNIGVVHLRKASNGPILEKFAKAILEFFRSKGLRAVFDNQDILINGFKTISMVETRHAGEADCLIIVIQFPMKVDMEAIQHICKKPMIKIPKGLQEFGIQPAEIIVWCNRFFETV